MKQIPKAMYTKEFREEAVQLAMTDGVSVSEAARRLSISMKTVANWVRAAKDGKLENVGQTQKPQTEIKAELGRVRRELSEVKMERDLLKNMLRGGKSGKVLVERIGMVLSQDRRAARGLNDAVHRHS
jgi:transposase